MPNKIQVGETIYVRSGLWSRFYNPYVVIGETSRSWIVASPSSEAFFKYDWFIKKDARKLPKSGKDWMQGTKRDHDLAEWVGSNMRTITGYLEAEKDNDVVLAVAKMLGVKNLFEEGETNAQGTSGSN